MKKLALILTIIFIGVSNSFAADERLRLAKEYVMMPEVQNSIDAQFSASAMINQMRAMAPNFSDLSEEKQNKMANVVISALKDLRPKLEQAMINSAAESFSEAELSALIDFYKSTHGASVMAKMQPYMQNAMARIGPEFQQMQQKIAVGVQKIFSE